MTRLPSIGGRDLVRTFERHGFSIIRIRGSHYHLDKPGLPTSVVIPVHGNRDVPQGTLRSIIRLAGLTDDEFIEMLRR